MPKHGESTGKGMGHEIKSGFMLELIISLLEWISFPKVGGPSWEDL